MHNFSVLWIVLKREVCVWRVDWCPWQKGGDERWRGKLTEGREEKGKLKGAIDPFLRLQTLAHEGDARKSVTEQGGVIIERPQKKSLYLHMAYECISHYFWIIIGF